MNKLFRQTHNAETVHRSVQDAKWCQLAVSCIGQLVSLHFKQEPQKNLELPSQYLEVQVKVVGLNAEVSASGRG